MINTNLWTDGYITSTLSNTVSNISYNPISICGSITDNTWNELNKPDDSYKLFKKHNFLKINNL